jgi:transcriptional regulator with XRE-family HTH domain
MTTWLDRRLEKQSGQVGFETERLLLDLTEAFTEKMIEKKWRRADLARRMGVDRSVITRVMAGDRNVSLRTLVSFATTLGCRLKIELNDETATKAETTYFNDVFLAFSNHVASSISSGWTVFSTWNASDPRGAWKPHGIVHQIDITDVLSSSEHGEPSRVIGTAA